MKNKLTVEWLIAALMRALRTVAQVALSMLGVGLAMTDIDWMKVFSVSLLAGIMSILTSVATGLPEASTDGELILTKDGDPNLARVAMKDQNGSVDSKKKVTFTIVKE